MQKQTLLRLLVVVFNVMLLDDDGLFKAKGLFWLRGIWISKVRQGTVAPPALNYPGTNYMHTHAENVLSGT
jgi:hypothetical protein